MLITIDFEFVVGLQILEVAVLGEFIKTEPY